MGRNHLFKKFVKAAIKDPQWHPEDRRTLATTRLDAETECVRKRLRTWIGDDAEKFGCTIALDAWTSGQVIADKLLYRVLQCGRILPIPGTYAYEVYLKFYVLCAGNVVS